VQVNAGGPVLAASNVRYEIADRVRAIPAGGIGLMHRLVRKTGLVKRIDERLHLLKVHKPYHESDHVLNIAYNALCGGRTLDDIELRRQDRAFLDGLGARSLPDPTTAGDFCRRFEAADIDALMGAINETRLEVWRRQPSSFFAKTATIEADGTLVPTTGECKEGMDISYNGIWGYSTLMVSLANTQEPLYLLNRSGNRPSHEGVVPLFDRAVDLCRRGGFKDILLRGDTDFSITSEFDRWTDAGVRFVFGFDATVTMKAYAETAPKDFWRELIERTEREIKTEPRSKPENVKEQIIKERGFRNVRTTGEDLVDFEYRPHKCAREYRVVALRKNLTVQKGEQALIDEVRYFFYITNDRKLTMDEVLQEARQRCNEENLIKQLKSGVRALHAPVNTLLANWAYMVIAALAWSLKAWLALSIPITPRWAKQHRQEREQVLRMEFRTFVAGFITVPCQIVKTGRRIVYRVLAWNRWQSTFFRLLDAV
jgi:hypothetical protein